MYLSKICITGPWDPSKRSRVQRGLFSQLTWTLIFVSLTLGMQGVKGGSSDLRI